MLVFFLIALLCFTMLYYALLCFTMLYYALLYTTYSYTANIPLLRAKSKSLCVDRPRCRWIVVPPVWCRNRLGSLMKVISTLYPNIFGKLYFTSYFFTRCFPAPVFGTCCDTMKLLFLLTQPRYSLAFSQELRISGGETAETHGAQMCNPVGFSVGPVFWIRKNGI